MADPEQVDLFLMINIKNFKPYHLRLLKPRLKKVDSRQFKQIRILTFHDPIIILILSLIGGFFAVDRFVIGDIGLGLLKLVTLGGLGIWVIVDYFLIMNVTKERNFRKISAYL